MINKTCIEFVKALASGDPVPGGGGASAYVGSLGSALGIMLGNLTLGKNKYADVQEDIRRLMIRAGEINARLNELVAADAAAFKPLAEAYRMPGNTPEEKELKEAEIQKALPEAAAVPLEIAKLSTETLTLLDEFARKGSILAVSDAGCGAAFCRAAISGSRLNVLINLKPMRNENLKESMRIEIDELTEKGFALADSVVGYVEEKLLK